MRRFTIERIAIFIEESNILGCMHILKTKISLHNLKTYLITGKELYNCFIYVPVSDENFHTEKNGYYRNLSLTSGFTLINKKPRTYTDEETGRTDNKCNFDVDITLDAVTTADNYDTAIFVTGDGDFCKLAKYLRMIGKKIKCVSVMECCNMDLINIVDEFINLKDIITTVKSDRPYH